VTYTSQQTSDFAVLSFLQFQFQNGASSLVTHEANLAKSEKSFGEVHPLPELLQRFRSWLAGDLTSITPYHLEPRMCQSLRQISVVGQQQQALGVFV
jgi:hypothetical protein